MPFDDSARDFLMRLLQAPSPAAFESRAADEVERYASDFGVVERDALGSCVVRSGQRREGAPQIGIFGHIDEIGLIVTRVDDNGFLRFGPIGSWDPAILVGQRVTVLGVDGDVDGVIGRAPIHMLRVTGASKRAPEIADLWIDISVDDRDEAMQLVDAGCPVVLNGAPQIVRNRIISRSLDNRLGTFVALEVLRQSSNVAADVVAVATVREEIGGAGARAVTPGLELDAAIIVDLSPASDTPVGHPQHVLRQGAGPGLNRGASNSEQLVQSLRSSAEQHEVPYQLRGLGMRTSTDADRTISAGNGVAGALVSLPARYAHSPIEMVHLDDLHATVDLLVSWVHDTYPAIG